MGHFVSGSIGAARRLKNAADTLSLPLVGQTALITDRGVITFGPASQADLTGAG